MEHGSRLFGFRLYAPALSALVLILACSGTSDDEPGGGSGGSTSGGQGGAAAGNASGGTLGGSPNGGASPGSGGVAGGSGGSGGTSGGGGTSGSKGSVGGMAGAGGASGGAGGTTAGTGGITSGGDGQGGISTAGIGGENPGGAAGGSAGNGGGSAGEGGAAGGSTRCGGAGRLMENLGRGLVAVKVEGGVYVGFRLLANEPLDTGFNVYRGDTRLNDAPLTGATNYLDPEGTLSDRYSVRAVVNGVEQAPSESVSVLDRNYIEIPLDMTGTTQGANHVGVGDLDGDGEFDYVVRRANQDIDPSQSTVADNTFKLEGYRRNGERLFRVDLGWNIRQGVWYAPFVVYDLDGDGKAEVITKIGETPGNDWNGDGVTDYRSGSGARTILTGPEYFAVLDGTTGEILARADWIPRGDPNSWGDDYGNRSERHLMTVAYVDGERPSVIILRGTYTKLFAEAWNYRDGTLSRVWQWNRTGGGGFHNLRVGDIDGDGKDEIINGSMAIDDDGRHLWVTGEDHGDRLHMTDIDPSRPGLEIFYVQESPSVYQHPHHLRDARTGQLIWGPTAKAGDNGRGNCGDVSAAHPGVECWSSAVDGLISATGQNAGSKPSSVNFSIWWDGDLLRELLDGTTISKYGGGTLLSASGCTAGSRNAPMGYGDVIGDWREEVFQRCGNTIRIYTTTVPTEFRHYTLMHDSDYRTSVASETMGYMQSTQPGFFFGEGMAPSTAPAITVPCRP
ncbi:MAG: rhamnogalacturonan lyase [Pseudomonadota bacterium]